MMSYSAINTEAVPGSTSNETASTNDEPLPFLDDSEDEFLF